MDDATMLRIDSNMLNHLNYSLKDVFGAQEETCGWTCVINPSVILVFDWLLRCWCVCDPGIVFCLICEWCFITAAAYYTAVGSSLEFSLTPISPCQPWTFTFFRARVGGACVVCRSLWKVKLCCLSDHTFLIYCTGQHKVSVINLSNWWNKRLLQEVLKAMVIDPPDNTDLFVWRRTQRV